MTLNFKVISDDNHFQAELRQASSKLVVVDFTSAKCGPCQRIGPLFADMATRFPNAVFLKVDINQCPGAAQSQGIVATPTFVFYRNKTKVDSIQGAEPEALELKIRQHYGSNEIGEAGESGVPGHIDLLPMINKSGCECLNESDDHPFTQALTASDGYLESDADEQLILYVSFTQAIKLHSLRVKAPLDSGPKTVKLFINQPYTLDFDSAETAIAAQELNLSSKELHGELIPLKFVKFQNLSNITVFVMDNQNESETTRIEYIQLIGSPVQTTNMSDFKRLSGKKGEVHQ